MTERPGYWDIVLAYIREGYRAFKERDVAYGVAVERKLGLDTLEGIRFTKYLEDNGFIESEIFQNAVGAYHLAPRGLALAEGLPSLDQLLAAQTVILNVQGPSESDKKTALATVREATLKSAIERGIDWTLKSAPQLYRLARAKWPWLPDIGAEDVTL